MGLSILDVIPGMIPSVSTLLELPVSDAFEDAIVRVLTSLRLSFTGALCDFAGTSFFSLRLPGGSVRRISVLSAGALSIVEGVPSARISTFACSCAGFLRGRVLLRVKGVPSASTSTCKLVASVVVANVTAKATRKMRNIGATACKELSNVYGHKGRRPEKCL